MLIWVRLIGLAGTALAIWFAYGWGSQIINNYTEMPKKIERLERDLKLVNSRVSSYRTLLGRRDAAIAASKCKVQIEYWVKNPNEIPTKFDPFNQLN